MAGISSGYSFYSILGDGVTDTFPLQFSLGTLKLTYVFVYVDGEVDGEGAQIYRQIEAVPGDDGMVKVLGGTVAAGVKINFQRIVPKDSLIHLYANGSILNYPSLDESHKQLAMMLHEVLDGAGLKNVFTDINMNGFKLVNIYTDLTDPTSVATVGALGPYRDAAEAAAIAAEAAEVTAVAAAASIGTAVQDAEAAAAAAIEAAASINMPTPAPADAGKGLVTDGVDWIIGGTAASANVGTGEDDIPTNSMVKRPKWYSPQTLVSAPDNFLTASIIATDEELVDVLTSANQDGYVVTAVGGFSAGYDPYKAFNHLNTSTQSYAGGKAAGNGFYIELPNVMYLAKYSLAMYRTTTMGYTVFASMDGVSWTQVDQQVAKVIGTTATTFTLATPMSCKFIKITHQTQDNDYFYTSDLRPLGDRNPPAEESSVVSVVGPIELALAATDGSIDMLTKAGTVDVPLKAVGGVLIEGTQFIVATSSALEAELATDLPEYNTCTCTWADGVQRYILGWAGVSGGLIASVWPSSCGTAVDLDPDGTILPNPFVHLPIVAVQDATVCPVVNNQITGVSTSGGPVHVWRAS